MPEITPEDILVYIYERKKVRAKDLEEMFEKGKTKNKLAISHSTLYKYKSLLVEGKKIKRKIESESPPYYVFSVAKRYFDEVKNLKAKKKLNSILENLSLKDTTRTFSIWSEIECVIQNMIKMDYTDEQIKTIIDDGLEYMHQRLVDQIIQDGDEEVKNGNK